MSRKSNWSLTNTQFCIRSAAIACSLLAGSRLLAANGTNTWTGNSSAFWNNAGNWTGANTPPISGDTLSFGAAGPSGTSLTDDLANNTVLQNILFVTNSAAYSVSG